jgi:AraC-like DNA-binding protein
MRGLVEYPKEYAEFLYYTSSELERAIGVCPSNAGQMIAKPNYHAGPKMVRFFIIHFVMEGQAVQWVNGRQIVLNKGDLFCLFPYKIEQHSIVPDNPLLRMTWLGLIGDGVLPLLSHIGVTEDRPYLRKVFVPGLLGVLQQLLDDFRHLLPGGSCFRWLAKLFELFDLLAIAAREQKEEAEKGSVSWIRESQKFMNTYFMENITVQDVADYAGVHRSYFSAEFSKRIGIPPVQYLQRLRMEKGAQMLVETEFPVTDIALSLGYPDLYTFTRAFRNYYSVTPSKFRTNPDIILDRETEPACPAAAKPDEEEGLNRRLKPDPDSHGA